MTMMIEAHRSVFKTAIEYHDIKVSDDVSFESLGECLTLRYLVNVFLISLYFMSHFKALW